MERYEHYIYMVLFLILNNELRHFGICNDDLLFPSNNPIFFPALDCYLQKIFAVCLKISLRCHEQ
jgi:hypothetical protein